ncbi:OsmC family protein [Rubrobacter aplysinae]|uniref:OsmC family protein n=1 Tax=Rubrobacter aplysinae TaxID=909625 RepID=UPI001364AE23|nr:OsmC family protein [Rubrobacter aplysinae]
MALRTWSRSLSGMQKEALVANSVDGKVWRLVSDEGPYLDGYDEAPFPLSHMTTGMVASYMSEVLALAEQRDIALRDPKLTLHNYYSMEGSARKGTMVGGALSPKLEVEAGADVGPDTLRELVSDVVQASPVNGLLRHIHESLFTLTVNGGRVGPERVNALDQAPPPDPGDRFSEVETGEDGIPALIELLSNAEQVEGEGGVGSSYADSQSRILHVRGVCTVREDGVKEVEQRLLQPLGSTFRFLSDEAPRFSGKGLAPDALTYVSAGVAFCFMTQFGRYAKITKKTLDDYRLVQDTHLSTGGASDGTGQPGTAEPVETHVYLETPEGEEFARKALDMSEQTCFLHALCRTELKTTVKIAARV